MLAGTVCFLELRIRETKGHDGKEKEEGIEAEAADALICLRYVVTITRGWSWRIYRYRRTTEGSPSSRLESWGQDTLLGRWNFVSARVAPRRAAEWNHLLISS